ncbi:MAG: hypothetical protein IT303_13865 [Dehalococcoidia bacterium]|nr:hypothetical protein [Dehalococcoidia bacterium]
MAGPLTNLEPVPLKQGEAIAVSFEAGFPDEWTLTWVPAPAQAPAPEEGVRAWVAIEIPGNPPTGTTIPSTPGRYVMIIFARWDGEGDIAYGIYAEVS